MRRKHKLILNGKQVSRKEFMRRRKPMGAGVPMCPKTYSQAKPLVSQGLGCLPHQVEEMRQFVKDRGLTGAEVRDDGSVAFSSRGRTGRAGLADARGLVDNDGGYGDG